MATDYSELYIDDTILLAKTIVVKSESSASLINSFLKMKYGSDVVKDDLPGTWKYYLNLSGQYHPVDTLMEIISLDTLETINFTVSNLETHTATREAYEYGTRYYYALLDKYPDQEELILGILYPVNIEKAIQAPNNTILTYPTRLVEPQEITLIKELQEWIYRYNVRWDVQAFGISDSLYPAAQHAIFYLNLLLKIFNLRLKRCKTSEAHSFHIRSYLSSHCGLDKYYDYMTLKQALFLYRNINYIERNPGKMDTFNWLIEKILTDRNIPIAEYQAKLEGRFDTNYYPEYKFKRIPLNTELNTTNQDNYTLEQILAKEQPLTPGNKDYILYDKEKIDLLFKNSVSSNLLTKNLESSMTDNTGNQINPLSDVLFNLWGWLAVNDKYRVAVTFKDPVTSNIQSLFTDDAFIYYVYLLMMSIGAPIQTIPKFLVKRVPKLNPPVISDLMNLVDNKLFRDDTIPKWLVINQPKIRSCFSVKSFYELGNDFFNAELRHWYLISRTEHQFARAIVSNLCDQFFEDRKITFEEEGSLYSEWLKERNLPTVLYSSEDCTVLMEKIFEACTGYSTDPARKIGNIQKAMISIMSDLSSYSVKFIQEINENPVMPLNWAAVRVGDIKVNVTDSILTNEKVLVKDTDVRVKLKRDFRITPDYFINHIEQQVKKVVDYKLSDLNIGFKDNSGRGFPVILSKCGIVFKDDSKNPNDSFDLLTDEQKISITDIYGNGGFKETKITERPIEDAIPNRQIDSFKFVSIDPNIDN